MIKKLFLAAAIFVLSISSASAEPSSVLCIVEGKYILSFLNAKRVMLGAEVSHVTLQNGTTVYLRGFYTCMEAYRGEHRAVLEKIKPAFSELGSPTVIDMGK